MTISSEQNKVTPMPTPAPLQAPQFNQRRNVISRWPCQDEEQPAPHKWTEKQIEFLKNKPLELGLLKVFRELGLIGAAARFHIEDLNWTLYDFFSMSVEHTAHNNHLPTVLDDAIRFRFYDIETGQFVIEFCEGLVIRVREEKIIVTSPVGGFVSQGFRGKPLVNESGQMRKHYDRKSGLMKRQTVPQRTTTYESVEVPFPSFGGAEHSVMVRSDGIYVNRSGCGVNINHVSGDEQSGGYDLSFSQPDRRVYIYRAEGLQIESTATGPVSQPETRHIYCLETKRLIRSRTMAGVTKYHYSPEGLKIKEELIGENPRDDHELHFVYQRNSDGKVVAIHTNSVGADNSIYRLDNMTVSLKEYK